MTVETRPMKIEDLKRVGELSSQLSYPVSMSGLEERYSAIASDRVHALFVAQIGDRVIGWIHVHDMLLLEAEARGEIAALVVDEGARRQGAGRALVLEARRWARGRGVRWLRVRSNVLRQEAHHFYPALGFSRIKTQHNYELPLDKA